MNDNAPYPPDLTDDEPARLDITVLLRYGLTAEPGPRRTALFGDGTAPRPQPPSSTASAPSRAPSPSSPTLCASAGSPSPRVELKQLTRARDRST